MQTDIPNIRGELILDFIILNGIFNTCNVGARKVVIDPTFSNMKIDFFADH